MLIADLRTNMRMRVCTVLSVLVSYDTRIDSSDHIHREIQVENLTLSLLISALLINENGTWRLFVEKD